MIRLSPSDFFSFYRPSKFLGRIHIKEIGVEESPSGPYPKILRDKYTWTQYSPTRIHQDFRKKIWSAIKERNPNPSKRWQHWQLEKWRLLCQIPTQNKRIRIPAKKKAR